jgi:hypothetical protein
VFSALSGTALAWDDEPVLAALGDVAFSVSYAHEGAVLIPCFAHVARKAGKQATLEFAARLGGRFPKAAAWVVAGLAQAHKLSLDDFKTARIWGVDDVPLVSVLRSLYLLDDPEAAVDHLPSERGALLYAADWADAVALLPADVREAAIGTIPDLFWKGAGARWSAAALAFVPVLPRERIDMLREVTPGVDSATDRAALGAAFTLRLAELGDPADAFAEARKITRNEYFAQAVAKMVRVLPPEELPTWLTAVLERLAHRYSRGDRACTLACALPRLLVLDSASLWSLIELWLSEDLSRSQLLTDLLTLGPVAQRLSGREAAADLARWAEDLPA